MSKPGHRSETTRTSAADALGSMPETSSASYADHSRLLSAFDHFASKVTRWAGTPVAFCVAAWAAAGP